MSRFVFALALAAVGFLLPSTSFHAFAATDPPAGAARQWTPGQIAARERQKKCGAEWRDAKANGKVPPGMTWPKFWSACNARLKAQGQ